MIKINLLNSVTERQNGTVAVVERRVSSPASRLAIMSVAIAVLLAAVIGWDIISTSMAKTEAERQLDEQKTIAAELEVVMNEQKDLETKIGNIDARIKAIKDLRASQAGPSAVLDAMRERIAMTPGLFIDSIEQNGESLTIKGSSPDEAAVTQFGRSLEFSNGLFSDLGIETNRADIQNTAVVQRPDSAEAPKMSIVNFTVRCKYTPSKAPGADNLNPTTASAQSPAAPAPAPPQVAKN
jgi:Tfp pilus assembly protein PilN